MSAHASAILYSAELYEREAIEQVKKLSAVYDALEGKLTYISMELCSTTVQFAAGYEIVSVNVGDEVHAEMLLRLAQYGVRLIAVRGPTVGKVDVRRATELGLRICRVPFASPAVQNSVAEYTVGLMLTLSRNVHAAYQRTRSENFLLNGLVGFEMSGKTVGIVGTGKVGLATAKILQGFKCRLVAYDVRRNDEIVRVGVEYVSLHELLSTADIVSIHAPSLPATRNLINAETISLMRPGTMVINTSRELLTDMSALLDALKSGRIGALGIDVCTKSARDYRYNHHRLWLEDEILRQLLALPNTIITSRQATLTDSALREIHEVFLRQIVQFGRAKKVPFEVKMNGQTARSVS